MMRYWFTPHLNRFDALSIAIGAALSSHDQILVAIVVIVVCAILSVTGESVLARRDLAS